MNWRTEKLGDICAIELGKTPARANVKYWDDKRVTNNVWLSIADMSKAEAKAVGDSREYLSDEGAAISKIVRAGTLLVSFKLTLGRVAFAGRDLYTNEAIAALRLLDDDIEKVYLYYFLQFFDWVGAAAHDVKLKGMAFNKEKLKEISVTFPRDRAEQRRIVSILDKAFANIAVARANAEKNLQNARRLFESYLQDLLQERNGQWETVTLAMLLDRGWILGHLDGNHGSDYPRKEEFLSEGVPYISANCIDVDHVDMSRAKFLAPARAASLRKGIAKDGDVLFAHNATVGPVALLHTDVEKVILGTSLTYYRCNREYLLPEYLAHYMRSSKFREQYIQVMGQSTRNQVPITKQREFDHVIPPLAEQKRIVVALDGLLTNATALSVIYQHKLASLHELKQSLLYEAFSGRL